MNCRQISLIALFCVVLFSFSAFGQEAGVTGFPVFAPIAGGPDNLNLANLNEHWTFPVVAKNGRGIPFQFSLNYDSTAVWMLAPDANDVFNQHWGWSDNNGQYGYIQYTGVPCTSDTNATSYGNWAYVDGFGTVHSFPGSLIVSTDPNCYKGAQASALATDQSGFLLTVNSNGPTATLQDSSGTTYNLPIYDPATYAGSTTGPATLTDRNGNVISTDGKSVFTDTLGQTVMSYSSTTGTYTSNGYTYSYTSSTTYTYKITGGGTATVTLKYKLYPGVRTLFGCSQGDIAVGNIPMVDTIVYADGSQYSFTYEATGSAYPGYITGRVASVTLPTGGSISYAYGGDGSGTINCNDGTPYTITRTTIDGTWTYTRTVPSSGTSSTTTVSDPQGNQTVYTFQNGYEVEKQVYQGSANGGTLLQTTLRCYNGNTNSGSCSTTPVTTPITQVTTFLVLPNNEQSETNIVMSSSSAAVTEKDEYDFGSGAPGALLRQTLTQYAPLANNILLPSSVSVKDGSGNQVAQTSYGYDENALTATSGLPQHGAISGSRGNLTSVHQWLNTTGATLNTTSAYDDAGQVLSTTDANNNTTSFSYSCSDAYQSTVALPNTGVAHTTSSAYDCNTGLKTSDTDQNGQVTSYSYDSLLRPTQTNYPDGGQTTVSYPSATQQVVQSKINSSTSTYSSTLVDGLGRVSRTIAANGESAPYDQQDTCYNADGLVSFKSYAYQGSGFNVSTVCSGAGDSYSYDALARVTSVTHSDGSSAQTTYSGRAIQIADEGNGSGNPTHIRQVDALGRTTATCEVSSATFMGNGGTPASCGLDLSGTGFLTAYTYDTLDHMISVSQGTLNPRTYVYDSLSRLVSATDPESGTTTYTYDNNGNTVTRTHPLENQTNPASTVTATNTYDALNRVTQTTYNDGITPTAHFTYDTSSGWGSGYPQNYLTGRMSEAWVTNSGGTVLAAQVFGYDQMGRIVTNGQCTPFNCGTPGYPVSYTYDLAGDMTSRTDGEGNTFSYGYNVAQRLTGMTSSLNDANHPGTLLGNAHYSPTQFTDSLGNGLADTTVFSARGLLVSQTVQNTGLVASPNDSAGNVAINGSLQSKTVQTQAATYASGSVTIYGSEQYSQTYGYEQGGVYVTVGSFSTNVSYGSGSTTSSIASALASQLNSSSLVSATASGSTINIVSKTAGTAGNYALSASSTGSAVFPGPAFTASTSGSTLTGGQNAVYTTYYDSGACTITVNSHGDSNTWSGSGTTAATIASNLVQAINGDSAAYVTASLPNPTTVALQAKQTGVTYPLSSSCTYNSSLFSSPSFTTTNSGANSGTALALPVYSYSLTPAPDGKVTGANDQLNGNWALGYDALNHLSSANKNSGQQTFSYAYDPFGNRWQQNAPQGGPAPQYSFDNNNRVSGSGITYDAAGNMLTDGLGDTFTWDAEGRLLTAVNSGTTSTYVYDAAGRRVQGPNGYYLYDLQGRAMTQINNSGTWAYGEIYAGNRHLATYSSGTTTFLHADWLGTKRVVTGVNGSVAQSCTGLAFGDGVSCSGTSTTYSGYTDDVHDPEVNLEHTWFRPYSSTQGRWAGPDPAGLMVADASNPQSWNRYAYVTGDPINYFDPLGLGQCADGSESPFCVTVFDSSPLVGAGIQFISPWELQPYCGGARGSSAGQCDLLAYLPQKPQTKPKSPARQACEAEQAKIQAQNEQDYQDGVDGRMLKAMGHGAWAGGVAGAKDGAALGLPEDIVGSIPGAIIGAGVGAVIGAGMATLGQGADEVRHDIQYYYTKDKDLQDHIQKYCGGIQ